MSEPLSVRFWRWLHTYSERRLRESFLGWWKHDRKCVNCKTWGSVHGAWSVVREVGPWVQAITCERCGYESHWRMDSMIPYLAETQPVHRPSFSLQEVIES